MDTRKGKRGRKHALTDDLRQEARRATQIQKPATTYNEMVNGYLRECELKEYSRHTIRFYREELKQLRKSLVEIKGEELTDINAITKEDIVNVIESLRNRGLKKMTVYTRLRAVKTVFNYAQRNEFIDKSPAEEVVLPKVKQNVGATLTRSQLKRLLDAPDLNTFIGLRDYVLMLTFAHTGARVSEVADLTVRSVNFEEDAILFTRTKNGNNRRIPMTKQLQKAMKAWIKVRGIDLETNALFITQYDENMDARQMQKRLKHYARLTKVEEEVSVSPHAFRRTFAKMKIQDGVDVFTVQALMGHSSLEQLRQYVMLYSEDLRKGIEKGTELT